METLDHNGPMRIVRPDAGAVKVHYTFDSLATTQVLDETAHT
jgi:hypothetical protein